MSTRVLRWIAVVLPVSFWLLVLYLRETAFPEQRTWQSEIFAILLIAVGAALFSAWVFRMIENREAQIRQRSEQLTALHSAALSLTTELDLGIVLQRVVDLARALVNAQYAALGVLDESGIFIEHFITSGISAEQHARIGDPPRGHGLLGVLIKEGKPIRIPEIPRDPRSIGFPPHHPLMRSLLGVPIQSKGHVIGDLYMADKVVGDEVTEFTAQDQQVLEMFATQAAIAIENAQLYRKTQQLAILQERERFGMDLHDGIIQSIYAIGLMLEDGEHYIQHEPREASTRIARAIHDLNGVIRDIRNYILDLRPQRFQGRDLTRGLEELARDLRTNSFLDVKLHADSIQSLEVTPELTVEVLHIVQEALTNVRKHARARVVDIFLTRDGHDLKLSVEDDGVGFAPKQESSGHGLRNIRERAAALGGSAIIEPRAGRGTSVRLRVPLRSNS